MSTLQIDFGGEPRSRVIEGLTIKVEYHFELKLLSIALVGGNVF
jgi:hypothetical protein